jgi:putative N6-adenine-specific DNA methylase
MDPARTTTLRLTCAHGQHEMLAMELEGLGRSIAASDRTGVEVQGNLHEAVRLNLLSRVAMRVLYLIDAFPCNHPDQLAKSAGAIPWETIIPSNGYLSVTSTINHPTIDNTMFANLRLKDAIVDRIRAVHGRRPDSGPLRTGVVVHLHWHGQTAQLWIDTSGEKLSDRSYRKMPHHAPLRETLAAAILMRAGYTGEAPIVIPMCGSGTLAIEAALMATHRPPGLLRNRFGFQHLLGFDRGLYDSIRREVAPRRPRRSEGPKPTIIATDIDPAAIEATRKNAETAGVGHLIESSVCDFADTPLPEEPGIVILHPEYGLRLGDGDALRETYARMGDFFKQRCGGWAGWIFTGNLELAKVVGLRTSCRVPFKHASVDARLLGYELWKGSRKRKVTDA